MPKLFIRLRSPAFRGEDGYRLDCEWLIEEDSGAIRARGETDYRGLSDLIDPAADWLQDPDNLVVIVPTEHVLAVSCEVPGRSAGQIRRALPFVVEEFVASDIEGMHLAHGPIRPGRPVPVRLIDRGFLESWLACFAELSLKPGFLVADADLLPVGHDEAWLLLEETAALIRTEDQAASVDRENLALALGSLPIKRLCLAHGKLSGLEAGQLDPELEVVASDSQRDSSLAYFAQVWRTRSRELVNLLQGAFEPVRPMAAGLARWRAVAVLAGVWVLLGLTATVAQAFWASARADALEARSEALYREIFPNEQRIVNVRRQMQQKLGQRTGGGTGFTDYLGRLAQGIDRDVSIQSIAYTDARDELATDLLLKSFDELEQMKQKLAQLGVTVEVTSAEQQDANVRARVRLIGAGEGA